MGRTPTPIDESLARISRVKKQHENPKNPENPCQIPTAARVTRDMESDDMARSGHVPAEKWLSGPTCCCWAKTYSHTYMHIC